MLGSIYVREVWRDTYEIVNSVLFDTRGRKGLIFIPMCCDMLVSIACFCNSDD